MTDRPFLKKHGDTIAAPATAQGGAIAVIRMSGEGAIGIADGLFRPRGGKPLSEAAGYTVHYGDIAEADGSLVDEVLITVFRAPHSYTGEDSVEISHHGSPYIGRRIMELLAGEGARPAEPGEFTVRAFLAGKLDLSQAEAVADLIASSGRAQHAVALGQMRGGYASELASLRGELVSLASLLELELDFPEEDVEFADRSRLSELAARIAGELAGLADSFSLGNAIRDGVPAVIVGRPNTGKSTLLNALVKDDRAMVSEIAGTTRDRIEERVNIGGVTYRFIDTAGLRATDDALERMGIERTMDAVSGARVVLLVADAVEASIEETERQIRELGLGGDQRLCVVFNKIDKLPGGGVSAGVGVDRVAMVEGFGVDASSVGIGGDAMVLGLGGDFDRVFISAKTGWNIGSLIDWLKLGTDTAGLYAGAAVVSNGRHYEALLRSGEVIGRVLDGLGSGLPLDLLTVEVRQALHHIGAITGEITTDELLNTIFSKFCIGK